MLFLLLIFSSIFVILVAYLINLHNFSDLKLIICDIIAGKRNLISAIFQVNEDSDVHGGDLVAKVLKAHGIDQVFTLCGGHISPILVGCEKQGIRVIDTRHEVSAVFAADAVSRLTQNIGVAVVTAGPGVTNTITAIKNAQMAESPLLLLGGAAPTLLKNRGALQDIEQLVLFRTLCKFTARISKVRDIVPVLRKAMQIARSDTPGPVFIEFPIDTLYPYKTVVEMAGFFQHPHASIGQKMLNCYCLVHLSRQFGSMPSPIDFHPLPIRLALSSQQQLGASVNLILASKKPLLLVGSQALLPPIEPTKLRQAVQKMRIPCYLGGASRGLLGKDCHLQMRQHRKDALKEADLVIIAGAICDFRLDYGRVLSRKSKVIAINRGHEQLAKNQGLFWHCSIAIKADVAFTLVSFCDELQKLNYTGASNEWLTLLRTREDAKMALIEEKSKIRPKDGQLNPLLVLKKLDQILTDDAILIADGGDFVGSAAYIVRPRGPMQWLDPGPFGTLGVGGGFALGAKCVHPQKPVWIIYGDGSCGFSVVEFDSFERHRLPVLAIVGNDACWSQIAREQVPMFRSNVAVDLVPCHYEMVAQGFGAEGRLVTVEDESRLEQIFGLVNDVNLAGKSVLFNVLIGKTDFRDRSISV